VLSRILVRRRDETKRLFKERTFENVRKDEQGLAPGGLVRRVCCQTVRSRAALQMEMSETREAR
jgi:hypothetical protein